MEQFILEMQEITKLFPGVKALDNVNLKVKAGEIHALIGENGAGKSTLMNVSGQTELAMSLFGKSYGTRISGTIKKDGKEIALNNVRQAIDNGFAYVTEDRKTAGLILIDDIKRNISLPNFSKLSRGMLIDDNKEIRAAEDCRRKFNIKSSSIFQKTGNLSGGNQQKVVLSRWIFAEPELLILDEPTRGIDVGAKYEIYTFIRNGW